MLTAKVGGGEVEIVHWGWGIMLPPYFKFYKIFYKIVPENFISSIRWFSLSQIF